MKFFIALLAVATLALSSADQGFVLRSYNTYRNYDFGRQYAAIVYDCTVPRDTFFVSGIDAKYTDGKGADDVQTLHVVHQDVRYFPHKVFDWYKNIIHIHVVESNLMSLRGEPLDRRVVYLHLDGNQITEVPREFFRDSQELQLLSMERNQIDTLDADLFVTMPKIRFVSFASNRIRTLPGNLFRVNVNIECLSFENNGLVNVGADLVKGLGKLKGVSFDGNVCINSAYSKVSNAVELLTREFTTNCGGRCGNMMNSQKTIYEIYDKIVELHHEAPKCTERHLKHMSDRSSESSESNESDENDHKNGPCKTCPHTHYNQMDRRN